MLLRHIDNVEERTDYVLQRVRDDVRRRDALLGDIRHAVHAEGELHAALQDISHVHYRLMPQYVHRSAALARTVAANASLAERSSKRVRRLDALLQRVQETSAIVDAMKAMEGDVAQVSAVLESGDIEKTVQLLHSYEAAQRVLTSASPGAAAAAAAAAAPVKSPGDADPTAKPATGAVLVSDVMRNAREKVQARLLSMMEEAVQVNDKLTIMKLTRLLAELGDTAMAARLYGDWIANHTIAALAKLIDAEMRKMDDPAKVAMTHLALVSQCLDTVAAAFESDEEFTRDAFGPQGPLTLLAELHSRATARCVPVLSDFIERRKNVLAQLENHAATSSSSPSPSAAISGGGADGRSSPAGASRVASPAPASQANSSANAVVASARRADQILEEISHMVSCGHIYLAFVERKQSDYEKRFKATAAAAAAAAAAAVASGVDGARGDGSVDAASSSSMAAAAAAAAAAVAGNSSDNLWRTRDNALLNAMQDILAFYVPLQNAYFTIAYDQAIDLQLRAIRDAAMEAAAAAARAGGGSRGAGGGGAQGRRGGGVQGGGPVAANAAAATSFMSGLQNIYSVATSSADELISAVGVGAGGVNASSSAAAAAEAAELASFWYFTHNGQVTLPDDVFFVLRMALHRAANTRSAQICSAVVMSAIDVVQSRLLPEIETHTAIAAGPRSGSGGRGAGGAPSNNGTGARRRPASHGGFLTPDELHWTGAGQQCATYLQRMADELQQLSEATFSSNPRDVARFRELASNMRVLGKTLQEKQIPSWLEAFSEACCDSVLPPHMERFAAVSYDMKEEVYCHYELNDVWVQACLVDLGAGLQYLHQHLADPKLFDVLLAAMARRTAKATSGVLLRKRFSLFGALQVDKDVRALRAFFVERALNDLTPIREAFAALSLMATLLLSDKPADALEEAANTALTSEEKKKVLLTRVEFRKETVTALPL